MRTDVTPNPRREFYAGQSYIAPTTHTEDRCRHGYDRSDNGGTTWYAWGSTWDTAPAGCPSAGNAEGADLDIAAVTISWTCTFSYRKTYDDPKPYVYSCTRYNNGSAIGSATNDYQDTQGASFSWTESSTPAYKRRPVSRGTVSITVTDNAGRPYSPDYYRWTYYYEATCQLNCKNTGKFWQWTWTTPWYPDDAVCKSGQVTDPWTDPAAMGLPACGASGSWKNGGVQTWAPSATGAWGLPYDAEYKWQGNNYALKADNTCTGPGGRILVDVGSGTTAEIKNYLGFGDPTKALHAANASTAMASMLNVAFAYFTDADGIVMTDALKKCRGNYILYITDGNESCLIDLTVPGQKAQALSTLSDPAGGVKTYVIGIDQGNLSTDEKKVLDDIASNGGTLDWYRASNRATLLAAMETILGEILNQNYSFASIILPRMRFKDNMLAIQGEMRPNTAPNVPFWKGNLVAYKLEDDGTLPADSNHMIDQSRVTKYWDAASVLDATNPDDRMMYMTLLDTSDPDWHKWAYRRIDFKPTAQVYSSIGCASGAWMSPTWPDVTQDGSRTVADCDAFVRLLRGSDLNNWGSKLGDIFHSQPVVVGSPSPTFVDLTFDPTDPSKILPLTGTGAAPSTYEPFRSAKSTRTRIAVVGANDGFLHAFNAGNWDAANSVYDTGTGAEEWAYLPPNLTSAIQNLGFKNGAHMYYVDGSPKISDVWLDDNNDGVKATDGSEWHTVALVNLRQGGTGIFHLDITDPRNPKPISNPTGPYGFSYPSYWSTCGQSWSEPAIGKVKVQIGGKKVDRWVAFFGDGDTSTNKWKSAFCGPMFYAVDLKTGQYLWYLYKGALGGGGTDETNQMLYDMVGSPILVDSNGDGYIDRVYAGDRGGQIWRFDVSAVATNNGGDIDPLAWKLVTNWTVSRLFSGPATQMFYEKPAAALDTKGNLWIFAGTGDRANPASANDPDDTVAGKGTTGRLYGIKDTYPTRTTPWVEADLEDVTGLNTLDPSALSQPGGWRFKLDKSEKNFTTVEIFNKVVLFSTVKPGSTINGAGCATSPATARLYQMYYLTGGGTTDVAAFAAATPAASDRYKFLGSGAPIRTVISTLSLGGSGVMVTGTNEQTIRFGTREGKDPEISFNSPNNLRTTRYWRTN